MFKILLMNLLWVTLLEHCFFHFAIPHARLKKNANMQLLQLLLQNEVTSFKNLLLHDSTHKAVLVVYIHTFRLIQQYSIHYYFFI